MDCSPLKTVLSTSSKKQSISILYFLLLVYGVPCFILTIATIFRQCIVVASCSSANVILVIVMVWHITRTHRWEAAATSLLDLVILVICYHCYLLPLLLLSRSQFSRLVSTVLISLWFPRKENISRILPKSFPKLFVSISRQVWQKTQHSSQDQRTQWRLLRH